MSLPNETLTTAVMRRLRENTRVAILMSGVGSNARALLENRNLYPNLAIVATVTDQPVSGAAALANEFNTSLIALDYSQYETRTEFFESLAEALREKQIGLLLYAGFMKVSPDWFVLEFPGINMHPADLTKKGVAGRPMYVGMDALSISIRSGDTSVASTLHIVDTETDCGTPLAVSAPLPITGEEDPAELHQLIKKFCEHTTYPAALSLLTQNNVELASLPIRFPVS